MYKPKLLFSLAGTASAILTSSQVCRCTTFEAPFPDLTSPVCDHDNCYNEMLDPRYNDDALAFCPTWLQGTPTTAAAAIPTYLENCNGDVIAVSSACYCIAWSATAAQVTTTQVTTTTLPGVTRTFGSSDATATAALCPATDGETIVDENGVGYTIHCASDSDQGSYASASTVTSYLDCSTFCDASSGCTAWVFVGTPGQGGAGSGTCWLKKQTGRQLSVNYDNYILGIAAPAVLASSPSTPASSVTYTTARPSPSVLLSIASSVLAESAESSAGVLLSTASTVPTVAADSSESELLSTASAVPTSVVELPESELPSTAANTVPTSAVEPSASDSLSPASSATTNAAESSATSVLERRQARGFQA